jgi:hypothetical protein
METTAVLALQFFQDQYGLHCAAYTDLEDAAAAATDLEVENQIVATAILNCANCDEEALATLALLLRRDDKLLGVIQTLGLESFHAQAMLHPVVHIG